MIKRGVSLLLIVLVASMVIAAQPANLDDFKELRQEQKKIVIAQLIKDNLNQVDLSELPGTLRFILGKPRINIVMKNKDGSEFVYGFRIMKENIEEFKEGGLEKPNYLITIKEEHVFGIIGSDDYAGEIQQLYLDGDMTVEPQTFGSKVKFFFADTLFGLFKKK